MTEHGPLPVRALSDLLVFVDEQQFQLSLERCEGDNIDEFLSEQQGDFIRKADWLCPHREFHQVPNCPWLSCDRSKTIFQSLFRKPFVNDGPWKGARRETVGVIKLEAPGARNRSGTEGSWTPQPRYQRFVLQRVY